MRLFAIIAAIFAAAAAASAQTNSIKISAQPVTTNAAPLDDLLINTYLGPANYATKRIAVTNFLNSAAGWSSGLQSRLAWSKLVFVDPSGNDASGVRENPARPFNTLGAAQAAALGGDTIVLVSGTYAASNLGKSNVNWFLNGGAVIQGSPAFGLTNVSTTIGGPGIIDGLLAIRLQGSTVEVGCYFNGQVIATGTNTLTFRNSRSTRGADDWLSASAYTRTLFVNHTAIVAPATLGVLNGSVYVP